jgi:hypothetical protein
LTSTVKERRKIDDTLLAIVGHPLRCQIFDYLNTTVASPAGMAREFKESVHNVGYHTSRLVELGVVEMVGERPVRGAMEHFYRGIVKPEIDAAGFKKMKPEQRVEFIRFIFQRQAADMGVGLGDGLVGERPDSWFVRSPGYVDSQGWDELFELFSEMHQRCYEVYASSLQRVTQSREKTFPVVAHLNCFETPR